MDSICRFVPAKDYIGSFKTVRFVKEGKFKTLSQPFYYPIHYLFLVTVGTGTLKLNGTDYPLTSGSLFFSFPQYFYEIDASDDFSYIYISFMGDCVVTLLHDLGACAERPVYPGFDWLIDFWQNAIGCLTPNNANLLTEGVLQYTLAMMMSSQRHSKRMSHKESRFAQVVEYVDNHYTDPELSLTGLAAQFSYTPKYLSQIFKQNMGIGFSRYLNNLRVQYACGLMERSTFSVTQIAGNCGFADPMYFSKVFKQHTGFSPQGYIKRRAAGK